jgi:hypothetical protein
MLNAPGTVILPDVTLCLNHLLLKCYGGRSTRRPFWPASTVLPQRICACVSWEPRVSIIRIARLLPALFLARIDGKSPIEYVTSERDKAGSRYRAPFDLLPYSMRHRRYAGPGPRK